MANPWNWLGWGSPAAPSPGPSRGLLSLLRQTVGGWLGPRLAERSEAGAVVRREKAAGEPRGVVLPNFLPWIDNYDDETPEMRRTYRKMLADPNIKSAVLGKILGVANLKLQIHPAKKKEPRAVEHADFVRWVLTKRLQGGIVGLVWSVLSGGLVDGYSVSEKVFRPQDRGQYAGKWPLVALKAKDVDNDLVLLTDEFKNVVGLLGVRYNGGQTFAPADFVIYSHLGFYGKPTGQSDLRAVYSRYWMLDTVLKLRAICLEKRAIPILIGEYADASQQPALERALALAKSQFWIALPKDCKVEAVSVAGQAESDFKSAIADLKHDIFLGIEGAILQSLEGTVTDGAGNSQVHKSKADLLRWHLSEVVCSLLNDHDTGLIRDVIDLNYVADDYPYATMDAVDVNELAQEITVDQGLHELGLGLSKEELYERYGRTEPNGPDDTLPGAQPQAPGGSPASPGPGGGGGLGFDDAFDAFCQDGDNAGKPGPCPEGNAAPAQAPARGGRATPQEKKQLLLATITHGIPLGADDMKALQRGDRAAMAKIQAKIDQKTKGGSAAELENNLLGHVNGADRYTGIDIAELHRKLAADHPGLSVPQLHHTLKRLGDQGKVRFTSIGRPAETEEGRQDQQRYAMSHHGEQMYHVRPFAEINAFTPQPRKLAEPAPEVAGSGTFRFSEAWGQYLAGG